MRKYSRDFVWLGLLILLPWLMFTSITLGNKTILPADALYTFEPFASAAGEMGVESVHNTLLLDLVLENFGWKRFLVQSLESRTLPLWNPEVFSGIPFWATGQHSALYPLTWLFFVFSPARAFGLFFVMQLGVAGCSMYALGRVLKMAPGGAFIAGLIFQFSGFMVISAVHPMILAAASWLPLLLAFQELTVRRAAFLSRDRAMLPWALLGSIVLGLQFFAGHAEISYFIILVMALYAGWRLFNNLIRYPRDQWRAEVLSPAIGLLLMVVIGIALAAVQLLPFYQAAEASFRQDAVTLQQVLGWAYPKRRIITFLIPNFFGNPTHRAILDVFTGVQIPATVNAYGETIYAFDWGIKNFVEGAAYVGILPLLLAVVAVLRPSANGEWFTLKPRKSKAVATVLRWMAQPYVPFFSGLALFSLGCIFGTPLYALVFALPFISQSHSPFRWVFPLTMALAALAGIGVTALVAQGERTPDKRRWQTWLRLGAPKTVAGTVSALAIWAGLAMGIGLLASRVLFGTIEPVVERAFWSLAKAAYAYPDHRAFYSYEFRWVLWAAMLLIFSGIAIRVVMALSQNTDKAWKRYAGIALLAALVIVDLMVFGHVFNPAVDASLLDYQPPVVTWLKQDSSVWRFSTFDPKGDKTFDANTGMIFGLQDARGYDSLFPGQYARYMGWITAQDELPYNRIAPFKDFTALDSPLVDLLNVKYIVTETEIPLPKYNKVYEDVSVLVYENLGVAPRAFTLPLSATVLVPDVDAVGNAIKTYDPRFFAIVEDDPDGWTDIAGLEGVRSGIGTGVQAAGYRPQTISAYGNNEVSVTVSVGEPSWLVLGDAFDKGWKAFVRAPGAGMDAETEVPIARVAGNFRGVLVEQDCLVRFKYSPDSVKIGAFTSFIAGMVLLLTAVIWLWRSVYRQPDDPSAVSRVAKNSVIPIALNIFNQAVTFAFAALTMRILGPGDTGAYYTAGIMFGWFEIIANFGLNTWLTREVSRYPQEARRYFLNTTVVRLVLVVIVIPLLVGFIVLRQTVIASWTQPASRQTIVALVLLYIGLVPSTINTGFSALFYAFEKAEYPAMVTSVTTLMRVTLGTLAILTGLGVIGLAGTSILVNLGTLVILAIFAIRLIPELHKPAVETVPLKTRGALRRDMVGQSWPLMLNHLLSMLFYKFDVTLMEAILGDAAVGVYSIGYKLIDALMIVPSMFTMALFPVISRQAEDNREGFLRFYKLGIKILLSIVLYAALATTFMANEMVLILGGPEFLPGGRIILQIIVWALPLSWINGLTQYVLIALNRQRYLTLAYIWGFAFSLLANLWLMPRYGYQASAVLHLAAELALFIPFVIDVRRQIGKIGWWQIVRSPVLTTICAAALGGLGLLVHRGLAVALVITAYPLLLWRLGLFNAEEKRAIQPMLDRLPFRKKTSVAPVK